MIKSDREDQGHQEQEHEHVLVISTDNQEEKEADHQDHELRGDDIRENRAHKEAVLTLEKRHAGWAMMADVKWLCDDPGRATSWTTQFQTPPQHSLDLFKVYFQGCTYLSRKNDFSRKAAKAQR